MVELVRAGVVEVLALEVNLCCTEFAGKSFRVIDRRGPPLEMLADGAQLRDEPRRPRNSVIGITDFLHDFFQLRWQVGAAIFAEAAFLVGVQVEVVGIISDVHDASKGFVAMFLYVDTRARGRRQPILSRAGGKSCAALRIGDRMTTRWKWRTKEWA